MSPDRFDRCTLDVRMPDLVRDDRSPSTYVYLLGAANRAKRDAGAANLQAIASETDLPKSVG